MSYMIPKLQNMSARPLSRRLALSALAMLGALPAFAQEVFPQRPIRLFVPYGAGSSIDTVTRMYAQRLAPLLGQPVVVENRPGAGGLIGTAAVVKAPADGYTLLVAGSGLSTLSLQHKLDFDPARDLAPVSPLYMTAYVLVAKPSFPANSLKELVALAKKQPGRLSYSTWGVGSGVHMVGELLKDEAGIYMLHVPYKGGGAESAAAVMAGDVDVGFDTSFTALPRIRQGQLKALGVFYPERVEGMENVQTSAEAGFANAALFAWIGVFAPARTPVAVLQKLSAASQEAMKDPVISGRLRDLGSKPYLGEPKVLTDMMQSESQRIRQLVAAKNMKLRAD